MNKLLCQSLVVVGLLPTFVLGQTSSEKWCVQAQEIVADIPQNDVDDPMIDTLVIDAQEFKSQAEFINSKSSLAPWKVHVTSYLPTFAQQGTNYQSLWCKMKKQSVIDKSIDLVRELSGASCSDVQQHWEEQITVRKPYLKSVAQRVNYETKGHFAGLTWAPSLVDLKHDNVSSFTVVSQSLMSSDWIPNIGGMHYCKMLSPTGLEQFLDDLYEGNYDRIPYRILTQKTSSELVGPSLLAKDLVWQDMDQASRSYKALLVAKEQSAREDYQGILTISTGGQLRAENYRALAKMFAQKGWIVFVTRYPIDLAVLERRNTAIEIGKRLQTKDSGFMKHLPTRLQKAIKTQDLDVIGFGHSLGGAVWGKYLHEIKAPFDEMVFYGVDGFIGFNDQALQAEPVHLLFGEDDSVVFDDYQGAAFTNFIGKFGLQKTTQNIYHHPVYDVSAQVMPELNHFCLISDKKAGLGLVRAQDGTPRPFEPCIKQMYKMVVSLTEPSL